MNGRRDTLGRSFWVGLVIGGGVLLFGIAGFARNHVQTDPRSSLTFLAGALVAHDALWAWLVAGVSVVLVTVVPARARAVVMGALATTAVLVLVSIPALTGNGRLANNPSILPRDYGRGLLIAVAVVWALAALLAVRALRRPSRAAEAPARQDPGGRPAGW